MKPHKDTATMATANTSLPPPASALSSAPVRSQTPDRSRESSGGRGGGRGNARGAGRGRGGGRSNNDQHSNGSRPATAVPYGHLPPFLPGASSLVEQLDQQMLVVLRDGRHLVGTLRTFDQFSNMVMEGTSERRILVVTKDKDETICYQTDIKLGLYIVRGDSIVLMGEVDDEEEQLDNDGKIRIVSLEEFEQLEEEETKRKEEGGEVIDAINWDFDMDLVA
ncbi:U6 snRNA-associated Sm-like protein LSm1 [Skeletonema marinoi]|uniref:U6 snRNA-associated Sm-like protein LSm1 n=1 Tax=Skeletonema marinoi TaxID=267567 RepID=A0AAD9DIG9_9STRA|nr:U6 snRNA-associated Sm-like protein LSm1 [Skeletonema marinoi]